MNLGWILIRTNLILHTEILQSISHYYLIQFSLIRLFEKHRPGFHSKSGGLKQLTELLWEGERKEKKICEAQMKSQQEFSLLTSPTTVTSHYGYMGSPGSSAGKESACNVGSLGSVSQLEDSLEEEMANHSSILAWRIPGTEEPRRLQPWGHIVGHDWVTKQST